MPCVRSTLISYVPGSPVNFHAPGPRLGSRTIMSSLRFAMSPSIAGERRVALTVAQSIARRFKIVKYKELYSPLKVISPS